MRLGIKEVMMPAYEYVCKDCLKDFTIFLSLKEYDEKSKIECVHCGSDKVQRKFTGFFAKTAKKS
ncbi:MAG: zinc ribbon domain-containing protein [Nitrospirae bacterium]|nr:zinc ribbon domain-containing protein [Nitrospirota bacterium]